MIQDLETSMTIPLRQTPHPARSRGRKHQIMNDVRLDHPRERPISAGVIRLGVAKEIVSVLRELRADPEEIISEAGLDPRLFDDGNNAIPFAALGRLVSLCVARTG